MKEALKLALEALEFANVNHWWGSSNIEQAITAVKEALAQPERPWVGLTKEEIDSALSKYQSWYDFAAHLENILKEKNQ